MDIPRILVVENDQVMAAGLRKRLQSLGYDVPATASSGEEAIEKAEQLRPHLVLMDIGLEAEGDGVEAAAQIRNRFRIPVVYLTPSSNQDVLDRVKVTEPYGYILKPYEERELQVVLETALYKHRTEQKQQEQEHWLAAVLNSIGEGVVATDQAVRVTFMNPTAEQLTGWGKDEARGHALEEVINLVDEGTRHGVRAPLRKALQDGVSVPMAEHSILIARDHTERRVEDCAAPVVDESGGGLGGVMVFRDVTGKREALRKLEESEERFGTIAHSTPMLLWMAGTDGGCTFFNRAWLEFRGRTVEQELGSGWVEGVHADDVRRCLDTYLTAFQARQKFRMEYRLLRADGEYRWILDEGVPWYGPANNFLGYIGSALDITDRKKAEEAVARLAAIVEASNDAIIGETLEGIITSWNPGAERLYGYTAKEAVGRPIGIVVPTDRTEEYRAIMERVRNGERVPDLETLQRRKDGKDVEVLVSISPVTDQSGQVVGAACITHDMTARKRLEAQYRQAQKMEAVGRLAGGVAHDFNNLLTVINGYSSVLLGTLHEHAKAREFIEQIRDAGERAAGLTQQLVAYSRKQIQQLKALNLNDLLANTERMLRRMIGEDVELVTVLDPGLHLVKADPGQIEQVVMNLAVNARDAMPTGGKLTIETKNVEIDEAYAAEVFEIAAGPYVVLAVTDTGCGMDAETQAHLFEPFFTTKEQGKGTGLGLATVYGIVKQSGGYITVHSELYHGTTFNLYLPSLKESARPAREQHPAARMPGGTETVLLVEDEDAVRALTHHLLKQCGYTVLVASSGREALEISTGHQGPIDLLVTDVVMPQMSGPQVAEALRLLHPNLPVLYLSGYTEDAVFRHGVLKSETVFLQKPFTMHVLAQKVRDVLDREG